MEFVCVVEFCAVGFQSAPDQCIIGYHVILRVLVSCRSRVVSRVRCPGGIRWRFPQLGEHADNLYDKALSFLEYWVKVVVKGCIALDSEVAIGVVVVLQPVLHRRDVCGRTSSISTVLLSVITSLMSAALFIVGPTSVHLLAGDALPVGTPAVVGSGGSSGVMTGGGNSVGCI